MAKYKQRQGLQVSPNELRKIADELEKEYNKSPVKISLNKKSILAIVNKTDESDTWEFEN